MTLLYKDISSVTSCPVPVNEAQRLLALLDLGILHTEPTPGFDAIVDLAREAFGAPIACVSLVADQSQWFKAVSGLDINTTSRDVAFCSHTIMDERSLVVEDATKDARFACNPLVTGATHFRFYAGHPLAIEEGVNLGTLCVVDTKPRHASAAALNTLRHLAAVATDLLRQHRDRRLLAQTVIEQQRQAELIAAHEREIERQRRMFDQASKLVNLGAWERDTETDRVSWTRSMYPLHEIDESVTPSPMLTYRMYPRKERRILAQMVEETKRTGKPFVFEGTMTTGKGRRRWVRVLGGAEFSEGRVVRTYGVKQDITAEKMAARKNAFLASRDPLTRLPNRRVFHERLLTLARSLKPTSREGFAVICVDVDDFKVTNDVHGHEGGDWLLQELARRLTKFAAPHGFVARLGGDEFGIVRPLPKGETCEAVGVRIVDALSEPLAWKGQHLRASWSVGMLAVQPGDVATVDVMLHKADVALYEAKSRGKNTSVVYSEMLETGQAAARQTVEEVGAALAAGQLELFYQPKLRLRDRTLQGFEALLRWRKPDGSIVAGDAMAPAFVDFKLSRAIGEFVVAQAIEQSAAWMKAGFPPFDISINLATSQLINPDFAADMIRRLSAAGLPPARIGLEVTETVIMSHKPEQVIANLELLKAHGVRISLDDFGTGYASLTHLRQLPVDEIKIDKSFIGRMTMHMEDAAIVQSVVMLARNLGLEVVAEGIERDRQVEYLAAIGCAIGQGYGFAKPMAVDAAEAWMRAQAWRGAQAVALAG